MQKKSIAHKYTLFLAVGIGLAVLILLMTEPEPQLEARVLPPLKVDVAQVVRKDVQPQVRVGGILQAARQAGLQFQIAGRVQARLVEPGQQVQQGDVLLRLDEGDFKDLMIEAQARLEQEKAAIERDRTLLKLAERNRALQEEEVKRQQRLGSDSLSSRAALDAARQRLMQLQGDEERLLFSVQTAKARLAITQAAAHRAERNWQRTQLTAPFAGTVNQVVPQPGDDVSARDVVVALLQLTELDFYAEIERSIAARLQMGQVIEVLVEGRAYAATVVALQQAPDPATYTYALRARFENPGLLPGMAVEALLTLPALTQVTVIPVSAVVHDDGETYLYVVESNTLQRRDVVLGPRQGDEQVVLEGLDDDEKIIRRGGGSLSDGQQVAY